MSMWIYDGLLCTGPICSKPGGGTGHGPGMNPAVDTDPGILKHLY